MNKKNASLYCLGLVLLTLITWVSVIKGSVDGAKNYKQYLAQAERLEEKGIFVDALDLYEQALELKPKDYNTTVKVADMYYNMGNYESFLLYCDKAITIAPKKIKPYLDKTNYLIGERKYKEAIEFLDTITIKDKEIDKLKKKLETTAVEKFVGYTSVSDWHLNNGAHYITVEDDGKFSTIKRDATKKIKISYDYLGVYDEDAEVLPAAKDGEYFYVDVDGNKKLVADVNFQYLGSFGNGYAPAQKDGKYGYIDKEFKEKNFEYEFAGAFANGVAAVKKGGKWALINNKFKTITDFEFDSILVDSNGFCSMFNVICAQKDGKYLMIDHNGKQIGKETFDDIGMAASNDGYIAVKIGEIWGFANQKGKVVIEPKYQKAQSFAVGLAPIMKENRWGYINVSEEEVIETKYMDATVFSGDGLAAVNIGISWNLLSLCIYE